MYRSLHVFSRHTIFQAVEDLTKEDDDDEGALPIKRSKHFDKKDASAKTAKSNGTNSLSKAKASPKPAAAQKAPAGKAAAKKTSAEKAKPSAKKAPKGRKAVVIDDDSDDDFQVTRLVSLRTCHAPVEASKAVLLAFKMPATPDPWYRFSAKVKLSGFAGAHEQVG